MRVTCPFELQLVLQPHLLIVELDSLLGSIFLGLQLSLLVLTNVRNSNLDTKVAKHLVFDLVHLRLQLLDLIGSFVHRLFDGMNARLQNKNNNNNTKTRV